MRSGESKLALDRVKELKRYLWLEVLASLYFKRQVKSIRMASMENLLPSMSLKRRQKAVFPATLEFISNKRLGEERQTIVES